MGGKNIRRDRQIVRVLWLLKALGEGAHVSVSELARRFGTRRETIYRDLRALEDIGYPIQGDENGRLSRPRLLDSGRGNRQEIRLTQNEYLALECLIKQSAGMSPLSDSLASAAAKLKAMQTASAEIYHLDGVFATSRAGVKQQANDQIALDLVKAVLLRRRCHVAYRSPQNDVGKSYDYDPYRLRSVAGGLYCIGKIPGIQGLTTLATERILSLRLTTAVFEPERSFDLDRLEREAFGVVFEDAVTVIVRVRADQAPYISEREWHSSQQIQKLPDGGVQLTFRAGGSFEIERWILGWGDAMEVIAPESLRESVKSKCRATLDVYGPIKRKFR
jgi:predicted DNA-binding transcriptional regulator YafY